MPTQKTIAQEHSVLELIGHSAMELGIVIKWQKRGTHEKGINMTNGKTIVSVDPTYFRRTEVETLLGDPAKANVKPG